MSEKVANRLRSVLTTASKLGKGAGLAAAQQLLLPHVLEVFGEHDHQEVKRMILADYQLVQHEMPEEARSVLENLGSNPELREQWAGTVTSTLTPENVLEWLHNADEYLDDDVDEERLREMEYCAVVIEDTSGGEAWLEQQILDLYRMAGIIPEDSTPAPAND